MAVIPVGQFGYKSSEAPAAVEVPALAGTEYAGRAAVIGGASDAIDREVARQREVNDAYLTSQTMMAAADANVAQTEASDRVSQKVLSGEIPATHEAVAAAFDDETKDIGQQYSGKVAQRFLPIYSQHLANTNAELRLGLSRVVTSKQEADIYANTVNLNDDILKTFALDPQTSYQKIQALWQTQGQKIGMPQAKIDANIKASGEKGALDYFYNLGTAARDSIPATQELIKQLSNPKDEAAQYMDTKQRDDMIRAAQVRIEQLEYHQQALQNKADALAGRQLARYDYVIDRGGNPAPEQVAALRAMKAGTSPDVAASIDDAIAQGQQIQDATRGPPDKMYAELQQAKADSQAHPTPESMRFVDRLQTTFDQVIKSMRDTPTVYLQERQAEHFQPFDAVTLATGLGSPAFQQELEHRYTAVAGLKADQPDVNLALLQPPEVQMATHMLKVMSTPERATWLGQLRTASPDLKAYNGMMAQIAPGEPVIAYAGELQARQAEMVANPAMADDAAWAQKDVAGGVLKGFAIMRREKGENGKEGDPSLVYPQNGDQQLSAVFADMTGGALADYPAGQAAAFQALKAGYINYAQQHNISGGSLTETGGQIDRTGAEAVARDVLGNLVRINGGKVLAPPGMTADEAETRMRAGLRAAALQYKIPDPGNMQLAPTKDDFIYNIRNVRGILATESANGPLITVDISKPYPATPATAAQKAAEAAIGGTF